MASQTPNSDPAESTNSKTSKVIRILALHGSEGTAETFLQRLEPWKQQAAKIVEEEDGDGTSHTNAKIRLEITAITAPVRKGRGFAWWSMPPYVRSFNATEYEHFDDSCAAVLEALVEQPQNSKEPFDFILGFSQGAILTTCLLALEKLPNPNSSHGGVGCILIGGAWPNPYTQQMEALKSTTTTTTATADDDDSTDTEKKQRRRRILVVAARDDPINAFDQSERVAQALRQGRNNNVTLLPFDKGGHVVPSVERQPDTVRAILEWTTKP